MEKFPSRYLFHSCEKAFRAVEIVRNLGMSKVKKWFNYKFSVILTKP